MAKKKKPPKYLEARLTDKTYTDPRDGKNYAIAWVEEEIADEWKESVASDSKKGNLASRIWAKLRPSMKHMTSDTDDEHTTDSRTQMGDQAASFKNPGMVPQAYYERMKLERKRSARYDEYQRLYKESVIAKKSLDTVVRNVYTSEDGDERSHTLGSDDQTILKVLEETDERVEMHDNLPKFCKGALRFGDGFIENVADSANSLRRLKWLNPKYMHRNEDEYGRLLAEDAFTMEDMSGDVVASFQPWQVNHIRYDHDIENRYGTSFLDPGRKPERQFAAMRDSLIIRRLTKATKRYAYVIPMPKHTSKEEQKQILNELKRTLRRAYTTDDDGKLDFRKRIMIEENDIFLAQTDPEMSPSVSMFDSGGVQDNMDDVLMVRDDTIVAYGVPPSYLGLDKEVRGRAHLGWIDIEFARVLRAVQRMMANFQRRVYNLQLLLLGMKAQNKQQFEVIYPPISFVDEKMKMEVERLKWEIAVLANSGLGIPTQWLLENIVGLNEEDIAAIMPNLEPKSGEAPERTPGTKQGQFTREAVLANARLMHELSDLKSKIQMALRYGLTKDLVVGSV